MNNDPAFPAGPPSAPPPLFVVTPAAAPLAPPARPAILTVIAIVNMVISGFALLSLPLSVLMFYFPAWQQSGLMGMPMQDAPEYAAWMRVILPFGALAAVLQLYASIRLLKGRESARKLSLACAMYGIIAAVATGYLSVKYLMPHSLDQVMKQMQPGPGKEAPLDPAFMQMMRSISQASMFMGIAVALLPPLATLLLLTRKSVRQFCQGQSEHTLKS